jgi:N,N'-diacetyllegionaminate synthase
LIKKTYIIAEVGPNHQGSLKFALKYVKELSKIGADAVKFQIGIAEEHYSRDSFKPNYHKKYLKNNEEIIIQAKKRLLQLKDHIKIYSECKKNKIDYICSAFDLVSLKFLYKHTKFPYFKIPSGEILTLDTLNFIKSKKVPIILSTGMASIKEINKTLNFLNYKKKNITLLHCVSSYPAKFEDLNLNFISILKKKFKLPVGVSDHSHGYLAPIIAKSLGVTIIEKHVTMSRKLVGPDHKASLTIEEFKQMIKLVRNTEKILGQSKKIISIEEKSNLRAVRKSCISSSDILKGEKITKKHISFKRPGTGINPFDFKKFLNKRSKKFIEKDRILKLKDFT